MQAYVVVLFLHLLALLLATGATVLAFFAALQLRGATAPSDVARWGKVVKAVVPCFPLATLVLAGSGAYLTQAQWHWTTPWIDAGIAGLGLLVICGTGVEGPRGRALAHEVRAAGLSPRARALMRDPLSWSARLTTLTLMVAVVFLMATKPSALGSVLALVAALLLGPLVAVPFWRSPARDRLRRGPGDGGMTVPAPAAASDARGAGPAADARVRAGAQRRIPPGPPRS